MKKIIRDHWLITIFLTFYLLYLSTKLITNPLPFYDWDESIYIQAGIEMIENRSYITALWQNQIWLDKPPLVPLLYGFITKLFFFIQPEVSTRLFSLAIAIICLGLMYRLYLKATEDKFVAAMSAVITAFTPLFLQRAQTVNLDMFVLLGWIGYVNFYKRKYLSIFFLLIAIFSKSLLGFYPLGILGGYYVYRYFFEKISKKELINHLKRLFIHALIASLWFWVMLILHGWDFWNQHIIESHFKRVTASIESHFGTRTFYVEQMIDQIGIIPFIISLLSLALIALKYLTKKIKPEVVLFSLYLVPWFMFLNVTKTKIFWYLLPAIPQFAFLTIWPIKLIKDRKIYFAVAAAILFIFMHRNVVVKQYHKLEYSDFSNHYKISLYAKDHCTDMSVLVSPQTRETYQTLTDLGLTITTTHWWGDHPSMVYYFGKPLTFIYKEAEFSNLIANNRNETCIVLNEQDQKFIEPLTNSRIIKSEGEFVLYRLN